MWRTGVGEAREAGVSIPAAGGSMGRRSAAFTLLELLIVVAIIGILAGLLMPALAQARRKAMHVRAIGEIKNILLAVEIYRTNNREKFPLSMLNMLDEVPEDPWGNEYVFNHFSTIPKGQQRKDRNLHPLNTVFDLFSKGEDGKSVAPINAGVSRDDIILADDGDFVGLAEDY
jgi:general secretion pathway protein G